MLGPLDIKLFCQVLCVHLGMTEGYIWDYGSESQRIASPEEFHFIQDEIHKEFIRNNGAIQYSHKVIESIMALLSSC